MDLAQFLEETKGGRIFSARFIKADGSERLMVCRRGVHKDLKGKGLAYRPEEKGLLGVWDMQKRDPRRDNQRGAYRMINLMTLQEVKFKGKIYKFHPETNELEEIVQR